MVVSFLLEDVPACGIDGQLPQELCDLVVDHLHDDLDTLKNASLVCHAWQRHAFKYLFHRFSWPNAAAMSGCDIGDNSFYHLARLLESHPRVSHNIRRLRLSKRLAPGETRIIGQLPDQDKEPLPADILPSIVDHVPQLFTLVLADCDWDPGTPMVLGRYHRKLPKLVLAYHFEIGQSSDSFLFLSCFDHVGQLIIQDFDNAPIASVPLNDHRTRIDNMSMMVSSYSLQLLCEHILPLLVDLGNLHSLEIFEWRHDIPEEAKPILEAAPLLEKLRLQVPPKGFTLPKFPALRSLTINFEIIAKGYGLGPDNNPRKWECMLDQFEALMNDTTEEICISAIFHSYIQPEDQPEQLKDLLVSMNWDRLRTIIETRRSLKTLRIEMQTITFPQQAPVPFEAITQAIDSVLEEKYFISEDCKRVQIVIDGGAHAMPGKQWALFRED